jgi:hypothetical protein
MLCGSTRPLNSAHTSMRDDSIGERLPAEIGHLVRSRRWSAAARAGATEERSMQKTIAIDC